MPNAYWQDKNTYRSQPRPKGWKKIRERIIARDGGLCQWPTDSQGLTRCGEPGTDVDHIVPAFRGGTDTDDNLWLLCPEHHRHKTSSDAGRESWKNRPRRQRPPERHPGLIPRDGE
jgi:5-methylcytosine-specific restriction protein A